MRLLLVRHAETAETGTKLTGRLGGIPLSKAGREAAEAAGKALAGTKPVEIITSPAERCRETAAAISRPHRLIPKQHKAFAEVDYGSWSGRRLSDLRRLAAWRDLMVAPSRFRFPAGESLEEVRQRSVSATEAIAGRIDGTVILVTHADVIRCLVCHYLGMPLDLVHRLHVAPTALTEIVLTKGSVLVPVVNQRITVT
ncbi:MAG: histidine phosphatase family protein [Actinomycetota bacterium]|nr:histidine phosphatase family protein [Actinomycetota bacterium]